MITPMTPAWKARFKALQVVVLGIKEPLPLQIFNQIHKVLGLVQVLLQPTVLYQIHLDMVHSSLPLRWLITMAILIVILY